MSGNVVETLIGAVVLVVAGFFYISPMTRRMWAWWRAIP